jgi:type IV pilus assembly protein PilN
MTTLTTARVAELPRVNLLPPEIAAASQLRRLQVLLGLLLLGVLAVVVMLFLWANGQVGSAEDELTVAQAETANLESQIADYAKVPEVNAQVDAAQAALVTAMTPEIRWSFLMNDLSLTIPNSSRLTTMTATNGAAAVQIDGVSAAVPTQLGQPTMGSITFSGKSTSPDAVAAWLQALSRQDSYLSPTLQSSTLDDTEATVGTVYLVDSTTSLSFEAASKRFERVLEGE